MKLRIKAGLCVLMGMGWICVSALTIIIIRLQCSRRCHSRCLSGHSILEVANEVAYQGRLVRSHGHGMDVRISPNLTL